MHARLQGHIWHREPGVSSTLVGSRNPLHASGPRPPWRSPWTAHRIILMGDVEGKLIPVTTLFITGPRIRKWGFHCEEGWVHEDEYFKQGGCQ